MLGTRWNWQQLFSYGEVICFASAWTIALVVAMSAHRPAEDQVAKRMFAVPSDVSGMQARR